MGFYFSMNAVPQDKWVRYRMEGKILEQFAGSYGAECC